VGTDCVVVRFCTKRGFAQRGGWGWCFCGVSYLIAGVCPEFCGEGCEALPVWAARPGSLEGRVGSVVSLVVLVGGWGYVIVCASENRY